MRSASRSILLIVDNVSSHRLDETLSNVTQRMLPPDTTAFLQPLYAGIISSFKAHIAKVRHRYVVDRFDELLQHGQGEHLTAKETDSLFIIGVLTAMRLTEAAWSSVTCATVSHCFRHTEALDEDIYSLVESFKKLRTSPPSMSQLLNECSFDTQST